MKNEATHRKSLADLSGRVEAWMGQLRQSNLDAIFVNEDWMQHNCSALEWQEHVIYRQEYWHEVFLCSDPSDIVFSDDVNCYSEILNQLKHRRLKDFGKVEILQSDWKTRPLIELSAARRKLSLSCERGSMQAINEWNSRHKEFLQRYQATMSHYADKLPDIMVLIEKHHDEKTLQSVFASYLNGVLQKEKAEIHKVNDQDDDIFSLRFPISNGDYFVLNPIVSIYEKDETANAIRGKLYTPFRIMPASSFFQAFSFERDIVIHRSEVISFDAYEHFASYAELALSMIGHGVFLQLVVADILNALRKD